VLQNRENKHFFINKNRFGHFIQLYLTVPNLLSLTVSETAGFETRSPTLERTISLRFLGIILKVLRLEVSVWIS
jgi:hypothetical protein